MSSSSTTSLPKEFLDCHHHFIDTANNKFQSFLATLVPNETCGPDIYQRDVVDPLAAAGVKVVGSIHMECMPDNGVEEVKWVESLQSATTIQGIVASCDLTQPNVETELQQLVKISPKVKGIRWILDCVGKYEPNTATHVGTTRHDGIDYLRGSTGGYNGQVVPEFERGYALLEKYSLSFDLQCAPSQLIQAAALIQKYPNIKVCLDHLGKPRTVLGPDVVDDDNDNNKDNDNTIPNEQELQVWRNGMKEIAKLPNVVVKISMLGYIVPGWIKYPHRIKILGQLVQETVTMFGPDRCMVATNYWKSPALADADGLSQVGPTPVELITHISNFLKDYSDADRQLMFCDNAKEFYKV